MMETKQNAGDRMVAKVLRDVLSESRFENFDDLVTALRRRLNRLRIPYQQHELDDALMLVGTNRPLIFPAPVQTTASADQEGDRFEVSVSRDQARQMFAELRARFGPVAAKPMPEPALDTDLSPAQRSWKSDKVRALRLVQQAILESAQHVAEMEAAIEPTASSKETE